MTEAVHWYGWQGAGSGPEGWRLLHLLENPVVVARSRTVVTESGLLRLPSGPLPVFRKTYAYRGLGPKLRGLFRTTFAAPGRAEREADALALLGALGLAPDLVARGERRVLGLLEEAILVTAAVPGGRDLDRLPPAPGLAAAVGRAAGWMHEAGYGRLSLSPRNLVAAPDGTDWRVLKVDSGRMCRAPRGGAVQARDLADLLAGLEPRWPEAEREALLAAYARFAGGLPEGWERALPAARAGLRRREPRG